MTTIYRSKRGDELILPVKKGDERILLVDHQDVIVQFEQMIEQLGYHVTGLTSNVEALEVFRANPDKFDVVFTDLDMPNMTGDKLTAEIMKIRSDIPVIQWTGFNEMISKEKAEAMGIKDSMIKPYMLGILSSSIREALDKK